MADSILTPGYQDPINEPTTTDEPNKYLEKDNYLSEYSTDEEKSVVRENLNIPSKDSVYTKEDTDLQISTSIREILNEYLSMEDPYGILPQVEEMIKDMVKTDGSTPFTRPQTGVTPTQSQHLATKDYIDKQITQHINADDPHGTLTDVENLLQQYVKTSEVYNKSSVYNKQETDNLFKDYIKNDGTTPFRKAQLGIDPSIDSHLTTKRYVDKILYNHVVSVDPHGFLEVLNQRLSYYAKKNNVFDKTQTYSRTQIDSIIHNSVQDALDQAVSDYMDTVNSTLDYIRRNYIKKDGTTPFTSPQPGVEAVEANHLVTLSQLQQHKTDLDNYINGLECVWKTSGPIESTVGHFEDNTPVPDVMSFQDVCDAIFYGKTISITVPEYVTITHTGQITVCVHGSSSLIDYAELYQNGKIIHTFTSADFEDGCTTVESEPITEDTEFIFKVYYTNGTMNEVSDITKVGYPIFVGLLPKWKAASTITMDYLQQLEIEDVEGTQNRFIYDLGDNVKSVSFNYKFEDPDLRHPFIVVAQSYPDLTSMSTQSQRFSIDAFDVIDGIPLQFTDKDVIFKIYVYKQALSSLNQEVTYNF